MSTIAALTQALSDRYRLERELGRGDMARELVTEVTARLMSLKRPGFRFRGHFSDLSRALKDSLALGRRHWTSRCHVLVVGAFIFFGSSSTTTPDGQQLTQNNMPPAPITEPATPLPAMPPAAEPATPPATPPADAPAANP